MQQFDYDLFVLGAGSGGVRAARLAASRGMKVAIAEERYFGGTCVNVGCIPKKLLVLASQYGSDFKLASHYGWEASIPKFNWKNFVNNKNIEVARLNAVYKNTLKNSGCEIIEGRANIAGPNSVIVGNQRFSTKNILIATGGSPFVPDFPGREYTSTSNEVFYLDELPKHVVIVGGGYIGVELSGVFCGLGATTVLVQRDAMLLEGFDEDIRKIAADEINKKGVFLEFDNQVVRIDRLPDNRLNVQLKTGKEIITERVVFATGRLPNTSGLGLENTKATVDKSGAIIVNENFQTSEPSIYALGDVINRVSLTPVALMEAAHFVKHIFNDLSIPVNYEFIPTAVFSQPSIGSVGLTESQARAQYDNISIFKSRFRSLKNSLGESDEKVFMKIIVDRDSDLVLGVHMVGPESGEIIQGIAIALRAGATKTIFDTTIGIHPTVAEEFVSMREAVN